MSFRALLTFTLALLSALLLTAASAGAHIETLTPKLPPGFEEQVLAQNLAAPTALATAPDGRTFVAEQKGYVKVFAPGRPDSPKTVLDLTENINNTGDLGLVDVSLDHDFARNGFMYVLYVVRTVAAENMNGNFTAAGRVSRFTINKDSTVSGGETVLLGKTAQSPCPPSANDSDCLNIDGGSHSVDTLRSAPDGTLWLTLGDGTNFDLSENVTSGRAWRAQDETNMSGKLVHIDRDGRGLPGHPFCPDNTNLDDVCTKLFAKGLRNPFRFTLGPDGLPIIGDVGFANMEEINVAAPGADYGWPCLEATIDNFAYRATDYCANYRATAHPTAPWFSYPHVGNAAVVGGPVLAKNNYPAKYTGRLVYGDYAQKFIATLNPPSAGDPGPSQVMVDNVTPVDLQQAPDGNLVYVDFAYWTPGRVVKLLFTGKHQRPVAKPEASRYAGQAPLRVRFSAKDSYDPEETKLSYRWQFPQGRSSTAKNPSFLFRKAGRQTVRLTVTTADGRKDTASTHVFVGRSAPSVTVRSSKASGHFAVGKPLTLRAVARTGAGKKVAAKNISWLVTLHHGDHLHGMSVGTGPSVKFMTMADHGADSYYEAQVTVKDGPVQTVKRLVLRPQLVNMTLLSDPPSVRFDCVETVCRTPYTGKVAVGQRLIIAAPANTVYNDVGYHFTGWTDGAPQNRNVTVPNHDFTFKASYAVGD